MRVTMIGISDAKAQLSEYARRVMQGERFIVCDRNQPFAELRPLRLTPEGRRPFGLAKGMIRLPDDFNAPDAEFGDLFCASGR
jgi:antitoxin (DNA-binding transcriptional repressor) of toxin-antitoxin stability system